MFIDKMIGGFFALNSLALFCLWVFRLRKKMAARKTFGLAACCFALSNKIYFLFIALALVSLVCGFVITDKRQGLEPAKAAQGQGNAVKSSI